MKNTIFFIGSIAAIFILVVTKPEDSTCIQAAMARNGLLGAIGNAAGADRYMYYTEDHFLYKNVISRLDGQVVARAYLGGVHF